MGQAVMNDPSNRYNGSSNLQMPSQGVFDGPFKMANLGNPQKYLENGSHMGQAMMNDPSNLYNGPFKMANLGNPQKYLENGSHMGQAVMNDPSKMFGVLQEQFNKKGNMPQIFKVNTVNYSLSAVVLLIVILIGFMYYTRR
jgi:hypothetical protein